MDEQNTDNPDVNTEQAEDTSKPAVELSFSDIKDSKGVPLENRWGEMTRKLNKVSDLESKLDQVLNTLSTQQQNAAQTDIFEDEFSGMSAKEIASVIDQKLAEKERFSLQQKHLNDFEKMKKVYPELDKNAPEYDPEFYSLANNLYMNRGLDRDPDGAVEAIEYAAYKSGRAKKSVEAEIISDEARRSRKLAEGTQGSRKAKSDVDELPADALKKLNINPKYFKAARNKLGQKG